MTDHTSRIGARYGQLAAQADAFSQAFDQAAVKMNPFEARRRLYEMVDLIRLIRKDLRTVKDIDPDAAEMDAELAKSEATYCSSAYDFHQAALHDLRIGAFRFSKLVGEDLDGRGLAQPEHSGGDTDAEGGVVDLHARRAAVMRGAAQVEALADAVEAVLHEWWGPYMVLVDPKDVPRFDERERYTAPRKFADLDVEVQALVKVLADHIQMKCLHPQADYDVHAILRNAVMRICRPPLGAPTEMSGNKAYAAQLRVEGCTEEEIAAELAEIDERNGGADSDPPLPPDPAEPPPPAA